jgi:hypothetical protein
MGAEIVPFEPLRNMSGLENGGPLENTEKVIENTVHHYKMNKISSIEPELVANKGSIRIHLYGHSDNLGFEIRGTVTSNSDFNGNEAIDYVYSPEGGLMTVKAKIGGQWRDVSENCRINFEVNRTKFDEEGTEPFWTFLGEKIIAEGKEKIVSALKINNNSLRFGKCRVFSNDQVIIDKIEKLVRIN